jgi:uncharacterized protein (DUF362 family)
MLRNEKFGEKSTVALIHRKKVSGSPGNYDQKAVDEVKAMLKEGVDYVGGMKKYVKPNDVVLLKVNSVYAVPAEAAWNVDPRLVEALVTLIKEEVPDVRKIIVADDSAAVKQLPDIDSVDVMEENGIAPAARRAGAEVLCLEYDAHIRTTITGARTFPYFECPKSLLDADVIITVPKWKNHIEGHMTLGIKNAQGYYTRVLRQDGMTDHRNDKERRHANDVHQKFVDTLKVIYPDLTITDGLWAIQGDGPGVARDWEVIRDMNMIVVSDDIVAADSVVAQASGYEWNWVPSTRLAWRQGFGYAKPEEIEIKGADLEKVMVKFVPPKLYDIQGYYDNVDVYTHGGCVTGCQPLLRMTLNFPDEDGTLLKLKEPINFIVGNNTYIPPDLKPERTCLLGDCLWNVWLDLEEEGSLAPKDLKDRGALCIPGCPSFANIFTHIPPWIAQIAEQDQAELAAEEGA